MTPSLSLVVPICNEEDNIAPLAAQTHAAMAAYRGNWELIFVDDGSTDASPQRLRQAMDTYGPHVQTLRLARNQGQTAALQSGFDAARGELIATLDGDLQNDPADIPRMVDELLVRDLDLLCGRRTHRQDDWLTRKLPSRIANHLIASASGVRLHDYGCTLKVYRAAVIKRVRLYGEMHRLIPLWAAMVTGSERIGETDVRHHSRVHGRSKYGLSRTFRVLLDLLTALFFLRFQARPGHFFGSIGLVLGGLGGLIVSYLVVLKLALGEDIGGRPLLLFGLMLLLFSVQFITTGVLAEILSRLFRERSGAAPLAPVQRLAAACWRTPDQLVNRPRAEA